MRIGVGVGAGAAGEGAISSLVQQIQRAEESGFDAVWMPGVFGVDAMMLLDIETENSIRLHAGLRSGEDLKTGLAADERR